MGRRKARRHRHKLVIHRRTAPGSSPGTIVADPAARHSRVQVIAYGPDSFAEKELSNITETKDFLGRYPVVWINIDGLRDVSVIERLGEIFGLHRLALEDVVNTHQRAKVDIYGDILFIVARMADLEHRANTEQLSMFVGRNFVLTFQEEAGDCWNPVRERIRQGAGRIRQTGADFLAYALLDSVIDAYFPLLEEIGERLDALEEDAVKGDRRVMERMHSLHSELLLLRRAIRPHREALAELARESTPVITDQTKIFLRDCYDHVIQIIDLAETYRELTTDLRDLYLSAVGLRTNDIMRVLTVIATLFMPLSFIASVYGMNFDEMPEIHWKWGYLWALSLMVLTAVAMLSYFAWRGWIGFSRGKEEAEEGRRTKDE